MRLLSRIVVLALVLPAPAVAQKVAQTDLAGTWVSTIPLGQSMAAGNNGFEPADGDSSSNQSMLHWLGNPKTAAYPPRKVVLQGKQLTLGKKVYQSSDAPKPAEQK